LRNYSPISTAKTFQPLTLLYGNVKKRGEKMTFKKGKTTIIIELNATWKELAKFIEYLQKNPLGSIIEMHVGNEVFEA